MWFVLFKIFRFGYSETKKYKAKKQATQQPPHPGPYDGSRDYNNEQYPMDGYPPPLPGQTPPPAAMGKRDRAKSLVSTILAIFQFAFGLAVIGLYSQDIHSAHDNDDSAPSQWVYAVVTAFVSTVTALLYLILGWWWAKRAKLAFSQRQGLFLPLFVWESVIVILWLVVLGIFGEKYIGVYHVGGKDGGDSKVTRMRRAVWVDLACLVFWIASAAWRGVRWWKGKGGSFRRSEPVDEKEMA